MMDNMMGGGWGAGTMLVMGLLWLLLLVAIVALVVWVARTVWRAGPPAPRGPSAGAEAPMDTLRRRYAAGELSHEEFERMKREVAER